MKWKIPHRIKIYEALGAIADKRIVINSNTARVVSSSGGKQYDINFDPNSSSITSNDNGSYWQGYLGYPAIAFLMEKGVIKYNPIYADALKGVAWKEINTKFKNDFDKTTEYIHNILKERGTQLENFLQEVDNIFNQISKLKINKLGDTAKPPQGY